MSSTATDVVRSLTVKGGKLAVVESSTGGLVAAEAASASRATHVFRGSMSACPAGVTSGVAGSRPQDGRAAGTDFVAGKGPFGFDSGSARGGKVEAWRLNGDREEIRRESVRSVLALLPKGRAGEQTGNERAQDTERNGGF
ncbi:MULTISPECIES: CinA family protein [Streptomyces]|uniref:CinA family protein n=1 Tax=Streptomyces koelreuteriae TaxID=2838015 RepID=A0ABX8FNI6_9ACTN|nr:MULTISPECIES: CinA family protein [Streptomyces]QWB22699.1 CinA family protein [Streptomyces koelreuteriae]UUA05647.1 CinA family protein [Streptomyces koelreuteriae]UUA13274.1 CinA family protein [Streptomyces sp. CRCS-T-1]